jgi:hypothetical protein
VLTESLFRAVRTKRLFLVADCGAPSPPYNPAHSHAGALSYELSVDGTRAVVDTGVGGYSEGEMRDYCRSTRAHNTLCVSGDDQSEMWASFRVAGRARCRAGPVRIISLSGPGEALSRWFEATCVWRGGGRVHSRRWTVTEGGSLLVVDEFRTRRREEVGNSIHFAPGWELERERPRLWACRLGGLRLWVRAFAPWREARLAECPVWRRLGVEEKGTVLDLSAPSPVERGAYLISLRRPTGAELDSLAERRLAPSRETTRTARAP